MAAVDDGTNWAWLVALLMGGLLVVAGLGLLGWQCLGWLQTGAWEPHSALQILYDISFIKMGWYNSPSSWVGIHKMLDWFNGGVAVMLFGSIVFVAAGANLE